MAESNPPNDADVPRPENGTSGRDPRASEHAGNPAPVSADTTDSPETDPEETESESIDALTALENELARWKDLALRARADLDNYRKRMSAEKAESVRYANQSLFESLLPVLDNFHFGLEAARNATEPQGVIMGLEMVGKQFEDFLQNHHITVVPAERGTAFDPNLHDAVAQEHDPELPEGTVLKVVRNGYRMGERLVRAANVVVSKGPAESKS